MIGSVIIAVSITQKKTLMKQIVLDELWYVIQIIFQRENLRLEDLIE